MCGGLLFCSAWHTQQCSALPGVAFGMRGGLLISLAWHTLRGSVLSGAAVGMRGSLPFRSVQHTWRGSVLSGAAVGMCGSLPFRLVQHTRWCFVLPGTASVVVFCPVWRGLQYAWWSSVPLSVACTVFFRSARYVYVAFFRSARRGICGRGLFCLAWLSVCVVVFCSTQCSIRGSIPFCPVRHMWWCSVLSGTARCAQLCCEFIIGGPGLLVALLVGPVVIGASDPRFRQ